MQQVRLHPDPPHGGLPPVRVTRRWVRGLILAALLAVALAYVPYRLYLRSGLARYLSLQAELTQVRERNQALRQDNRRLLREIDQLRTDERAIERVAREELGLVRAGEIVFKVEERPGP
ncbi:MAG: septum formation initiator family protein [Myxococcales bacterium]|nr:septum formation initiator family protein [Myxococcota bacterium]MDW8283623.1 septum formation initiator family protein [Myxococcales bacterium]